jgi:exocyst complex component 2
MVSCQTCLMFIGLCSVQLARRVREMREARAAPSVQAIEQKAVAAQKALTSVQTLPRGVEVLDPLGLG